MKRYNSIPEWDKNVIKLFLLMFVAFIYSFIENKFDFRWLRNIEFYIFILYCFIFYYLYMFYGDYQKLVNWIIDNAKNIWIKNSNLKNIMSLFFFATTVLTFIYFWGPSENEKQIGINCNNAYSELYETERITRSYSIKAMNNSEDMITYFGYLNKEYQLSKQILDLGCEDLNSNIRIFDYSLTPPPQGDLSGSEVLVQNKICYIGYELQWFEDFYSNKSEIKDWRDSKLDCSRGKEFLGLS
tara:strand:+ start:1085 stop:1810 length:726 start_codon:yes stop_codon:yes gene_type:complete